MIFFSSGWEGGEKLDFLWYSVRLIGSQKKVSCENQTLAAWLKLLFVTPDFRTGSAIKSQGFSFSPSVWSPGGEEWSNNKERSLPMTWFHTQKAPATPPKDTDSTSNFCKTTAYIMGSFSLHHQQMQHVRIWKNIPFLRSLLPRSAATATAIPGKNLRNKPNQGGKRVLKWKL